MQCERCNGVVTWRGPLSNLTHTQCESCGGINCQRVEYTEDDNIEERPTMTTPQLTDEQIDAVCAPGRAERWKGDGRQYDRDTARLIECAILAAGPGDAVAPKPGWLPIETAPKDGTHIILSNGATVAEGWWEYQEPYIREKRDIDGRYIDQEESDGFDGWLDCQGGMQPDPTQWMPLPAAQPGAQEQKP